LQLVRLAKPLTRQQQAHRQLIRHHVPEKQSSNLLAQVQSQLELLVIAKLCYLVAVELVATAMEAVEAEEVLVVIYTTQRQSCHQVLLQSQLELEELGMQEARCHAAHLA
jgi:hypothetical protein